MANILVIAPHPDDEVLGCGGTIRRMATAGERVTVAIVTTGLPLYPETQVRQVRAEAARATERLGVHALRLLDLPVTKLHLMPEHELNGAFFKLFKEVEPDPLFIPFARHRREDHTLILDAALVASRPDGRRYRTSRVCCYETVSETHWSAPGIEAVFEPTWFVDISATLGDKLDAMRCYESQLAEGIPARSLAAI